MFYRNSEKKNDPVSDIIIGYVGSLFFIAFGILAFLSDRTDVYPSYRPPRFHEWQIFNWIKRNIGGELTLVILVLIAAWLIYSSTKKLIRLRKNKSRS